MYLNTGANGYLFSYCGTSLYTLYGREEEEEEELIVTVMQKEHQFLSAMKTYSVKQKDMCYFKYK